MNYPQYYRHNFSRGWQVVKFLNPNEQVYITKDHYNQIKDGQPTYFYSCSKFPMNDEGRAMMTMTDKSWKPITGDEFIVCLKEVVEFFVKIQERLNAL